MSDAAVPALIALASAAVTTACAAIVTTRVRHSPAARWFLAAITAQSPAAKRSSASLSRSNTCR